MQRAEISVLRLVTWAPRSPLRGEERIAAEHPTVTVMRVTQAGVSDPIIDADAWSSSTDFVAFDDAVARSSSNALSVRGARTVIAQVALEALTRWQRFVNRRNDASRSPQFDAALRAHAAMHDVAKPLVRADFDHAIDTWQWMLRLAPDASSAAQLAALFHDVERLESEADRRIEHHAPDYAAFKDAHAWRGAQVASRLLVNAGVDETTAERVRYIIAHHERRGSDPDIDLLNDADALSFFSLNSAGYASYFGPEQTRKKVAYTLARLGSVARARFGTFRLRPDVAAHVDALVRGETKQDAHHA